MQLTDRNAVKVFEPKAPRIVSIAKIIGHRPSLAAALIAILCLSATQSSLVLAEDKPKRPKIGELFFQDPGVAAPYQRALHDGLRELGYVDGKTATFVTRFADGDAAKLSILVADILAQKVDVMFIIPRALVIAKQMTSSTPLVTFFSDPIKEGIVTSFARPGGNITGVSWQANESSGKRLQYMMELVPGLKRVTLLYDPDDRSTLLDVEASREAALSVGLAVDPITFRNVAELQIGFAQIARAKPQGMIVVHSPLTVQHRIDIVRFALHVNLPLVSQGPDWAHAGALLSYGPNIADVFKRAGTFMGKILKGAKVGEMPIEQPTLFELVVNEETAKALGIKIPESIMLRADEVIR